ncbi:hypothetical protein VUR80DRAFT_6974 [Thermomyces stellatus]
MEAKHAAPSPEYQMGPMSPQATADQQAAPAPGQYAQPAYFPPQGQQPQQPPPGYAPQPQMDPNSPGQPMNQQMYPGQPQAYGTPLVSLTAQPAPVACPHCGHRGMTAVGYESGGFTHLMALLFCCIVCLGCIPYLIAGLKDVHHKCASCGTALATYHRSGRTEVHYQPAP